RAVARSATPGARDLVRGSGCQGPRRLAARRAGAKVSAGRPVLAVVLGVSAGPTVARPAIGHCAAAFSVCADVPAVVQAGGGRCANCQGGDAALPATFVRHASAAVGLRHPDRAVATGPCRCVDDDDLYARTESRRSRGEESAGFLGRGGEAPRVTISPAAWSSRRCPHAVLTMQPPTNLPLRPEPQLP